MSSAVPAVCPTTAPLSMTSSLSVYKGAKAMAETISVFTQKSEVLFGGDEQLFPADIETQEEQPGSLGRTPRLLPPQQAWPSAQGDIAQDEIPKIPGFRVFGHSGIHFTDPQIGQPVGRIQQAGYAVVPFDRLQQENDGGGEDSPVAPVAP